MIYTVILSPEAEAEIEAAYHWLVAQTPQHGPSWYNDLLDAVLSLNTYPGRCPLSPESNRFAEPTRQLLHGNKRHAYRILFILRNETVYILHIRHAARL